MSVTSFQSEFSAVEAPPCPARDWAMTFVDGVLLEAETLYLGWPHEALLGALDGMAEDNEEEDFGPRTDSDAWLAVDPDLKGKIMDEAMRRMAVAVYRQHRIRPRLTKDVRRFLSMMFGWWPEGVGGAPANDFSMFGDGEEVPCRCCGRAMGRHEEFRVIVYSAPTSRRSESNERVPICWSCIKGAKTN